VQLQQESAFKKNYLGAYLLAMFADWLQGPYVYALYLAYGFSKQDNGFLFIMGFGSSMLFGTFIGGFADKFGRKKFAILYCATYGLSTMTKHFNSFAILMFGRLLAGIATSLLFSTFESWLVCEHKRRGLREVVLGDTFSNAILGNSIVAVGAGFVAQHVSGIVGFHKLGEGNMR
jgi:MFS transporter, MFS domain-containing protein family, molybdate-anion transporter